MDLSMTEELNNKEPALPRLPGSTERRGLFLLRIATGTLLVAHGLDKLINFEAYASTFPSVAWLSGPTALLCALLTQLPCGLLILAGYRVRLFAIPPTISLLIAAAYIHLPRGVAETELPVFYAIVLICLIVGWGDGSRHDLPARVDKNQGRI